MRQADPAKASARKCDRSKVAGCLGCELGLKELKPCQLYEWLLRQGSLTSRGMPLMPGLQHLGGKQTRAAAQRG